MGAIVSAAFVYYECLEIRMNYVIGILVYLAVACIYPLIRQKFHKVEIEVSTRKHKGYRRKYQIGEVL